MKKITQLSFLLLTLSLVISSCGIKNSDNSNNTNSSKTQEKAVVFEGKYVLEGSEDSYLIFRANGTGEENSSQGLEQFEWRKSNGQLCMVKSYQIDETSEPIKTPEDCGEYTLTGNKLTWKIAGITVNLIKVQ
jgi:hypothetical protein